MNRDLWLHDILDKKVPPWPCPTCGLGNLAVVPDTWRDGELVRSRSAQDDPDWDPDWIEYQFSSQLQCRSDTCGETVELVGRGGVEPAEEEGELVYREVYRPLFANPMPAIFVLPEACPSGVRIAFQRSFRLFWSDAAAAANAARVGLEILLEEVGYPAEAPQPDGSIERHALHHRLTALAENEPEIGSQLMAVKWLGNTASHKARVIPGDVLDSYEILEDCLAELVAKRSERVAELTKRLSGRHKR